jgi:hypothetical protein
MRNGDLSGKFLAKLVTLMEDIQQDRLRDVRA